MFWSFGDSSWGVECFTQRIWSFGDRSWGIECFTIRILLPRQTEFKRQSRDEIESSGHDSDIPLMN